MHYAQPVEKIDNLMLLSEKTCLKPGYYYSAINPGAWAVMHESTTLLRFTRTT